MPLPDPLTQAISKAHAGMLAHLQHDLNLGYRHSIWTALGPKTGSSANSSNPGFRRRAILARLSAQYSLPIWDNTYPHDDTPAVLLRKAAQILHGSLDQETAWNERNKCWDRLIELGNESEQAQLVSAVGLSAVQALTVALEDEKFASLHIDTTPTDAAIDPDEMDSSFFAAVAYASGATWNPKSNAQKRQEFWNWWLTEAVPMAYTAVS